MEDEKAGLLGRFFRWKKWTNFNGCQWWNGGRGVCQLNGRFSLFSWGAVSKLPNAGHPLPAISALKQFNFIPPTLQLTLHQLYQDAAGTKVGARSRKTPVIKMQ